MRTLTIKNPWAWLIVQGGKNIENRSWNTSFRGRFLIHAGGQPWKGEAPEVPAGIPFSAIIGSAELYDVVPDGDIFTAGNPWAMKGFYHWMLGEPIFFEKPILSVKGQLGWWDYPIEKSNIKDY